MSRPGLQHWIQSGDLRRAASALVVSYGSDVLATCMAMVRDRAAAEDVMQDVFGEALRGLAAFRGESSPRTWLLSITRNRCIDYLRARKRDPWAGARDDASADPDDHADQKAFGSEWLADRSVVLRGLDALAEGDRALVVLRFKNGLEYDELATAFGLREGTVRMRVSRALARMRQVLEGEAAATPAFGARPAPAGPSRGFPPAPSAVPDAARARGMLGGAARAPDGASSWWARLEAWAGLGGAGAESSAPARPVGDLGAALAESAPSIVSEALATRLGALVDGVGG